MDNKQLSVLIFFPMLRSDHVLSGRLSEVKTRHIFKSSAPKVSLCEDSTLRVCVCVCVGGCMCVCGGGGE